MFVFCIYVAFLFIVWISAYCYGTKDDEKMQTIMRLIYVTVLMVISAFLARWFLLGNIDTILSMRKIDTTISIISGLLVISSILIAAGLSLFQSLLAMDIHNPDNKPNKFPNFAYIRMTLLVTIEISMFNLLSGVLSLLQPCGSFTLIEVPYFTATVYLSATQYCLFIWFFFLSFLWIFNYKKP